MKSADTPSLLLLPVSLHWSSLSCAKASDLHLNKCISFSDCKISSQHEQNNKFCMGEPPLLLYTCCLSSRKWSLHSLNFFSCSHSGFFHKSCWYTEFCVPQYCEHWKPAESLDCRMEQIGKNLWRSAGLALLEGKTVLTLHQVIQGLVQLNF